MNTEEIIDKIQKLEIENENLKTNINSLRNLLGSEMCKYFEISNSLKQTKKRFCYDDLRECYEDLVYFYGCSDPIQDADDYKECYKQIFGKDYFDDSDEEREEDKEQQETYIDKENYSNYTNYTNTEESEDIIVTMIRNILGNINSEEQSNANVIENDFEIMDEDEILDVD